ncbi:MAG: cytochrome P450 [Thermosynechococcaceae cyanobacterium]
MMTTVAPSLDQPLPDGPRTSAFWQLLQWIGQPIGFMENSVRRYGDMFTLRLGRLGPLVFLCNPQAIEAIFTADPNQFDAGSGNRLLIPLLGDTSVILLSGDRHRRQRQLLMPPFHGERMRTYGDLMVETTKQVTARWTIGPTFPIRPFIQDISLQIILKAVFGVTDPERFQALRQLLPAALDKLGSPISSSLLFFPELQQDWGAWSPWGQFVRLRSRLDQLIYAEIHERRAHPDPERTDILALMLSARDDAGQPMTDIELRDELITLLFAGHETTTSVLIWALYWVHRLPNVLERLVAELTSVEDLSDTKTIMRLPYLAAVCQETLRLYPIAPIVFPRILKTPFTLLDRTFAPGTRLAPCIYLTHQRPDLYPDPKTFRPERFLERQFSPYEYMPFGGGDRRCLGMAFAQFELKLVLATLLKQFRFELPSRPAVKPVRRGVTLAPPANLKFRLIA